MGKHLKLRKSIIALFTAGLLALQPISVLPGTPISNEMTVEAASTKLSVKKKTIKVGGTYTLKLKNNKKTVKWSASNKNVKIKKKGKNAVTVTGRKKGKAVVTAKVGSKKYKCTFTVKEAPKISKAKVTLQVGKTYDLTVTGASSKPKWATTNKSVATIKKISTYRYRVTAKKDGTAAITCKVANKNLRCNVTVTKKTVTPPTTAIPETQPETEPSDIVPDDWWDWDDETETPTTPGTPSTPTTPTVVPVTSITMTPASVTFAKAGETRRLSYTINPSNTTMDKKVVWVSLNPDVVTVDSNGKITAVANGTATVVAELCADTSKAGLCQVTVAIPDDTPPNTSNLSYAGGESDHICVWGTIPEATNYPTYAFAPSGASLSDFTFEIKGDSAIYESQPAGDSRYTGVSFQALRAGTFQILAKYQGSVFYTWNITVKNDWDVYVKYYNWKASVESQIWNSTMTTEEKLDAARDYIKTNFTYSYTDASAALYSIEKKKIDCFGASEHFARMAKDLGVKVVYTDYTGAMYEYKSEANSNVKGHMYNAVYLNGEWIGYDACPPSSEAVD